MNSNAQKKPATRRKAARTDGCPLKQARLEYQLACANGSRLPFVGFSNRLPSLWFQAVFEAGRGTLLPVARFPPKKAGPRPWREENEYADNWDRRVVYPEKGSCAVRRGRQSLTRYSSLFNGVEINSTFYRRHKPTTFERWAHSVPANFRFSIKIPKEITHNRAMKNIAEPFDTFLEDIAPLGSKCGPLLCQLPPSLTFDADQITAAFKTLRRSHSGQLVIEARHKSWASAEALNLLKTYAIDRVLADPAPVWPAQDFAQAPRYVRLHGTPKIYYSKYTEEEISAFSKLLAPDSWCVFDNTASGAAIENALTMLESNQARASS